MVHLRTRPALGLERPECEPVQHPHRPCEGWCNPISAPLPREAHFDARGRPLDTIDAPELAANGDIAALIRTIPDYPKPGILFRDVTTLLLDAAGFDAAVSRMAAAVPPGVDLIAGIEARGFVFAAALARELGKGLLLIRKRGKLPGVTVGVDYALEYGEDRIEMHADACAAGQRVMLVDDLIATGGTAMAAARLIGEAGAEVAGAAFVIDLPELGGAKALRDAGVAVTALVAFAGH